MDLARRSFRGRSMNMEEHELGARG
jgi:hypothetical protein